jgi:hypothetical protein
MFKAINRALTETRRIDAGTRNWGFCQLQKTCRGLRSPMSLSHKRCPCSLQEVLRGKGRSLRFKTATESGERRDHLYQLVMCCL